MILNLKYLPLNVLTEVVMETVYIDSVDELVVFNGGVIQLNPDTTYTIRSSIKFKWQQKRKLKRFNKKQYQAVINWR